MITEVTVNGEWKPKVENSHPPKIGPKTLPKLSKEEKIPMVVP